LSARSDFISVGSKTTGVLLLGGVPCEKGLQRCIMIGRCMSPWILPGDRLIVDSKPTELKRGMIALYSVGDRIVAHRVVRVVDGQLFGRGDSATTIDGPIPLPAVLGRVIAVEREGWTIQLEVPSSRDLASIWSGLAFRGKRVLIRSEYLTRRFEVDVFSMGSFRGFGQSIGRLVLGDPVLDVVRNQARVLAEALSVSGQFNPFGIESIEQSAKDELLRMILIGGKRFPDLGRMILVSAGTLGLVHSLHVKRGWRGMGLGRSLLERAVAVASEDQWTGVVALVPEVDERSLGLFRSRGFFESAPWERPAGLREADHWLVKRLKG